MNGTNVIGGGTVGSNPGPSWHVIDAGDFNGDSHDRYSLAERQRPGRHLADEWDERDRRRHGRVEPGPSWHVIDAGDFNGDSKTTFSGSTTAGRPPSG